MRVFGCKTDNYYSNLPNNELVNVYIVIFNSILQGTCQVNKLLLMLALFTIQEAAATRRVVPGPLQYKPRSPLPVANSNPVWRMANRA